MPFIRLFMLGVVLLKGSWPLVMLALYPPNTMFMFHKDTAACSHTKEGPQSQSHCTLITHLALSGLSGSFTCHLIWHTSRWWSAESSVSLFTWVSKSYSWDEMVKWIKNKNLVTPPGLSIVTYMSAELLISKGFAYIEYRNYSIKYCTINIVAFTSNWKHMLDHPQCSYSREISCPVADKIE